MTIAEVEEAMEVVAEEATIDIKSRLGGLRGITV